MASTRSTIEIFIRTQVEDVRDRLRGLEVGLRRVAAVAADNDKALSRLGKGIGVFLKSVAAIGAVGNAVGFVVALTGSLTNLLPVVALAPAGIFILIAAIATFKLATAGFADAVSGDAEAMAKLAPSARETAKEIQALKPAFENLRKAVQQEFFKNFAADVKVLGATYLPILQAKLPRIAAAFNEMGRSITRALTTNGAADDINIALTNTAKFLENARNAVGHLVTAFIPLIAVGSTYLPNLGRAIDGAADRFRAWSLQVTSDGSLRRMIDDAIQGWKDLGAIVANIGGIIGGIFTGLSQGSGQDFLTVLRDSTQAIEDFVNEGATQEALKAIGAAFKEVADVTREVFLTAMRELAPIVEQLAPVVAEVAHAIGDLLVNAMEIAGPVLEKIAGFLNDNKTAIADLAPLVLALWVAFRVSAGAQAALTFLRRLGTALGGPIGVLRAGGLIALGALAIKINDINKAAAEKEGRPLSDMEDSLDDIVGAGREIATLNFDGIFSEIGEEWDEVVTKFQTGESPIGGFFKRLGEALEQTRQSFIAIGTFIGDFVTKTGQSFGEIGTAIGTGFSTAVTAVRDFFTVTIPGIVTSAFTTVRDAVTDLGTNIGTGISDFFTGIGTTVQTKLTEIGTAISDFFAQTPYEMGRRIGEALSAAGVAIAEWAGQLVTQAQAAGTGFLTTVGTWLDEAVTFFQGLPARIGEALASLGQTLADKATEAGTAFLTWISSFFDQTTARVQRAPKDLGDAVAGTATSLGDRAREAGQAFLDTLTTKFNEAVAYVQGVPARAGAAISAIVGILLAKATEAGQSFINGLTAKFNEAVAYVQGIPGRLAGAIGNLGGLLVAQGRALIDGLTNGIKQGYQNALDFVRGIADGLAAVKGPLSYDKIVMRPAGLALMSGLLSGLKDGNTEVMAYVSTIADQLAAPLTADLTSRVGTMSVLPTNTILADARKTETDRIIAALADQQLVVRVDLDGEPVRSMVTSTVSAQDRDSARRLRAGSGASW